MPRSFHKMPALPDAIDDPKVKEFMSHYFATSNHDSDHEGFADMFIPDGEYSMNKRKAKGRKEIIDLHRALYAHIPSRDHYPLQIYTHGHDQMQLISRGEVHYKHHHGHETSSEWAAYYELVKDEKGELKFKKVHIIADSAAQV